ncbi:MAG: hypothetical protein R2851_21255 [Caldilineaceae bacterium]
MRSLWYAENRRRDAGVRINNMNELASATTATGGCARGRCAATASPSAVPPTAPAQEKF